jgi:hypothetical protein
MKVKTMPDMFMLPAPPDCCQECAVKHSPQQPHDKQSLYYQIKFLRENGRTPTWEDAMAHCDEPTKTLWKTHLEKHGVVFAQKEGTK